MEEDCLDDCSKFKAAEILAAFVFLVNFVSIPLDLLHLQFGGFMKGSKGLEYAKSFEGHFLTFIPALANVFVTGFLQFMIAIYASISTTVLMVNYVSDLEDGFKLSTSQ